MIGMCNYNHELCQYDLRGMSKHEVNQHYFEFIRNATKEEYDENGWCITSTRGLYECRICGKKHSFVKGNFKKHLQFCKNGCNGCKRGDSGNIVIVGYNNVGITDPDLIPFFVNPKDAYTHTRCSHDKVDMVCPYCRHNEPSKAINNLTNQGFSCPTCGDGISYPEKVVALILTLLGIKFKREYRFDGYSYKYDFYLVDYGIIIEVHGEQHYRHTGFNRSYEDEHENDLVKYDLAVLNCYEYNKNYFVINAKKTNIEYIRNSIQQCKFFQQLDLSIIDWKEIDKQAQTSQKIDVCKRWKEGKEVDKDLTTFDLAKEFGIHNATIYRYLTWGNKRGLCEYVGKQEQQDSFKRASKFVYLVTHNGEKWFDKPMTQNELARQSGISRYVIQSYTQSGKPLKHDNNIKYDPKYIGSRVVLAHEYDAQNN